MTSLELREARTKLVGEARSLIDSAKAENRDLTDEESTKYDEMIAKVESLAKDIERTEKLEVAERSLKEPAKRVSDPIDNKTPTLNAEQRDLEDWNKYLITGERRTIQVGTDSAGGFLLAPVQVADEIIQKVDKAVFIREHATMHRLTHSKKIGIPKLDNDLDGANWGTTEITQTIPDSGMVFARVEIEPILLSKLVKVSHLALASDDSIGSLISNRISNSFSQSEEEGFMNGDGDGEPLGIFTADDAGIPTSRDVVVTDSTSAFNLDADKLIDAKYNLRPGYRNKPSVGWVLNSDVVSKVRQLKDDNGSYIWQPSLQLGVPDRLLGIPVYESEHAPSTFSSGSYVGMLGDLSEYHIVEVPTVGVQRLEEKYADTHEVGFMSRTFVNGNPGNPEAFVRLKVG